MLNSNQNNKTVEDFFKYLQSRGIAKNTFRYYRSDFLHFERWMRDYFVNKSERKISETSFYNYIPYLTKTVIEDYVKSLEESGTPVKTINRRLSTIRHLSNYLQMYGYTNHDITKDIENANREKPVSVTVSEKPDAFQPMPKIKPSVIAISFGLLSLALVTIILTSKNEIPTIADANLTDNLVTHTNPTTFSKTININTDKNNTDIIKTVLSDTDSGEYFGRPTQISSRATITSGQTSTTINHPLIKADMLIYLTPVTSTFGESLFVSQVGDGYFTISIDKPVAKDIDFNWFATISQII